MPVKQQTTKAEGWCKVRPNCESQLAELGLRTARDFLAIPGVVVSGHVGRNVSRVQIGENTAFLKREHFVRVRDRLRSLFAVFEFASVSEREAIVVAKLEERGLPVPSLLAFGEVDGQAFVLLDAALGAKPLCDLPRLGNRLAQDLGHAIAAVHNLGIDQPDLFAKHILINPKTRRITIIDWQRAGIWKKLTWRQRINSLAALQATAFHNVDGLPKWWMPFLSAYLDESKATLNAEEFAESIWMIARRLRQRRSIQRQLHAGTANQELVRSQGETVCAIPDIAGELVDPATIARVYDRINDGKAIAFANGRNGILHVGHAPVTHRLTSVLLGKSWRSPELKMARLLFHLERHGIAAPKLLAYGQVTPRFRSARSFVIQEPTVARPIRPVDSEMVFMFLSRLHEASCSLRDIGPNGEPFGVVKGEVVLRDVSRVQLVRRLCDRQTLREFEQLIAFFEDRR